MNIRIGDVRTFLWENRVWVAVVLMVVVSLILWPLLVRPMNAEIEDGIDTLKGDKARLTKYAKMPPQSLPAEQVLKNEKRYRDELNTELNKMRQKVGKGDFKWDIALPEPGQKYPDPRKFKLGYDKKKRDIIKESNKALAQFAPGILTGLFWDIRGEPSPAQMLIIQKEFSIIKALLDTITDSKTAVSYTHTLSINPGKRKFVPPPKFGGAIVGPKPGKKPSAAAGAYRIIRLKLVLDIDYRTLNLLIDGFLRSPHKINLNIRLIHRLGMIGEREVLPLVRVDMDLESVDFNPVL